MSVDGFKKGIKKVFTKDHRVLMLLGLTALCIGLAVASFFIPGGGILMGTLLALAAAASFSYIIATVYEDKFPKLTSLPS